MFQDSFWICFLKKFFAFYKLRRTELFDEQYSLNFLSLTWNRWPWNEVFQEKWPTLSDKLLIIIPVYFSNDFRNHEIITHTNHMNQSKPVRLIKWVEFFFIWFNPMERYNLCRISFTYFSVNKNLMSTTGCFNFEIHDTITLVQLFGMDDERLCIS